MRKTTQQKKIDKIDMAIAFFKKLNLKESDSFRGNPQYIGERFFEGGKVEILVDILPKRYELSFNYSVSVEGGFQHLKEDMRQFTILNDTETMIYFMVQYLDKTIHNKWEELSEARQQNIDRRKKEIVIEKFQKDYGVVPDCEDYSHDRIGIVVPEEIRHNLDLMVSMVQNPEFIKLSKQLKKVVNTYKAVERL